MFSFMVQNELSILNIELQPHYTFFFNHIWPQVNIYLSKLFAEMLNLNKMWKTNNISIVTIWKKMYMRVKMLNKMNLVGFVSSHINPCRLFNAISCLNTHTYDF